MRLRIATRRSRLALWQAEHVKARMQASHAGLEIELLPLSTRGDELGLWLLSGRELSFVRARCPGGDAG